MKTILNLFLVVVVILLLGFIASALQTAHGARGKEVSGKIPDEIVCEEMYNGHLYTKFLSVGYNYNGYSVVHSPNCKCMKK